MSTTTETATNSNSRNESFRKNKDEEMSSDLLPVFTPRSNWWKVCWVYGDQTRNYRALYSKHRNLR